MAEYHDSPFYQNTTTIVLSLTQIERVAAALAAYDITNPLTADEIESPHIMFSHDARHLRENFESTADDMRKTPGELSQTLHGFVC